ncbi:MAG: carbohydrate ABC transporter permease [Bacteroidota bacterium]
MATILAYHKPAQPALSRIKHGLGLALLSIFAMFFLVPLLWLCYVSFLPKIDIFRVPPAIIQNFGATVRNFSLVSFRQALVQWHAAQVFLNSIVVTGAAIVLTLLVSSLTAYAFAFLKFRGRNALFFLVLCTMMLPMVTMITPFYQVVGIFGLRNKLFGVILPYTASAFNVFLLRQYFVRIPTAFFEAAVVDGASKFRIWWRIVMPLSKPALIALAIYQFRTVWNDFLNPMLILRDERLFTIPIKLQFMDSQNINVPWDAMMAIGFVGVLVPVLFFLVFQRQFMEGISGGIKG